VRPQCVHFQSYVQRHEPLKQAELASARGAQQPEASERVLLGTGGTWACHTIASACARAGGAAVTADSRVH
jgi:hypothetical protein